MFQLQQVQTYSEEILVKKERTENKKIFQMWQRRTYS